MKAVELLQLYAAGRRDFSGESLRGQNFKGKNLSGADFSLADIRSADFTNANLTGANFTQAKAGLQRRWVIGLVVITLLLSIVSGFFSAFVGYFVALIFDFGNLDTQIAGWVVLAIVVVFLVLLLRKGIVAAALAGALAGALALGGALTLALGGALTLALTLAGAIAETVIGAVVAAVAGAVALASTLAVAEALVLAVAIALGGAVAGAVAATAAGAAAAAGAVAAAVTLTSAYVGWRTFKGDERDAWIRPVAIAFATIGGASFRAAILTDADFSQAWLKSTDFRRAVLFRTRWRNAEKLDRIRPGETYLNNPKIRQLALTGNGQGQAYDNLLNLGGINLQGANLVQADFTGSTLKNGTLQGANLVNTHFISANLNQVNLQDADLSNAKLVQTQLDQADLTGSTLTGAYIEDWGITTHTKLHGIRCDYVFMRLPPAVPSNAEDANPHRKPDNWNKIFEDGEFSDFIAPMVETLDLYHNQEVDPRAVAIAFHDLREQNPEVDLDIVSMEKRGKKRDKLLLRAEVSSQADLSELNSQYFDRYDYLLTLSPEALQALLIEKDKQVKMLARMVDTAIDRPSQVFVNQYNNQGDVTVSQQGANTPKYDMRGSQFAGGFAETVQGDQIGGNITNQAAQSPSLAEAAAEIQTLLKQLEASNPQATEAEQANYLNIMISPTRRQRFIGALQSASSVALDEIPYGPILKALVEGWNNPNS